MKQAERFLLLAALGLSGTWVLESATLLASPPYRVHPWMVGFLILAGINGFLILRSSRWAGWFTLLVTCGVGMADRASRPFFQTSDVLNATYEALEVVRSGHNPYLHSFALTSPPGSPFPYLPGELAFYAIASSLFHGFTGIDKMIGILTIPLIALLAPIVGAGRAAVCVAMHMMFGIAIWASLNGSNDCSLAFLLVAAVVLLAWSEAEHLPALSPAVRQGCLYASAVVLGWAMAFKAFAWPFLPFIAAYLFARDAARARRYLLVAGSVVVVAVLPFLFPNPAGLIGNVAKGFTLHQNTWGIDVWAALATLGIPVDNLGALMSVLDFTAMIAVFIACLRRPGASLGAALLRGVGVFLVGLLLARWSSPDYYAFVGSVLTVAVALA